MPSDGQEVSPPRPHTKANPPRPHPAGVVMYGPLQVLAARMLLSYDSGNDDAVPGGAGGAVAAL